MCTLCSELKSIKMLRNSLKFHNFPMFITLVFPLFFQILDFVMTGRRIVRLSEALDSLQIFFELSMVAHRLVENYWNRF